MSGTVRLDAPAGPSAPPYELEIEALVQTLEHLNALLSLYADWYGEAGARSLWNRAVRRAAERQVADSPSLALQFLGERRNPNAHQ